MRETKKILMVLIPCILVSFGIAFLCIQKDMKCDEHIILNDGVEYDCRGVSSFSNGMSTINMCDGERIDVPTHRIKQVTKIKTK
jgi:hypothetical protein